MANIATLTAKLEADIRDFDRDMKTVNKRLDQVEGGAKKAGGAFKGMGKLIGGLGLAVAAKKIGDFARDVTMLAVDAEEAGAAFKQTFGPAVDDAQRFVDEFANKAGFAEHELQQLLATSGNVVQGLGGTEQASADLSQQMAILAGDVASFSNAAGGAPAVMKALQSALTGEREALKTYGIVVSETEVIERALQTTHKTSAAELTKLEKAQATMTIATERAGKAVGDLDRTQDSAANSLRRFNAKVTEAKAEIGRALVPILSDLLDIGEDLIPVFQGIAGAFVKGLAELKPFTSALGTLAGLLGQVEGDTEDATTELNWYQKAMKTIGSIITDTVLAPMRSLGDVLGFVTGATREAEEAVEAEEVAHRNTITEVLSHQYALRNKYLPTVGDATTATEDLVTAMNDEIDALKASQTEIRKATDPLFRLKSAQDDLIDAADNYNRIAQDQNATLDDQNRATLLLYESWLDYEYAQGLANATGDEAWKTFERIAEMLGLDNDALRDFLELAGQVPDSLVIPSYARQYINPRPVESFPAPNTPSAIPRGIDRFAAGGVVPGPIGAPQLAVVHGGETVTPPGQQGGGTIVIELDGRQLWTAVKRYAVDDQIRNRTTGLN